MLIYVSIILLTLSFDFIFSSTDARIFVWSISIIILGAYFAFSGKNFDLFEPRFFVGISFVIFYGFGTLFPFFTTLNIDATVLEVLPFFLDASIVSFFCLFGFAIGYELYLSLFYNRINSRLIWKSDERKINMVFYVFVCFGLIGIFFNISGGKFYQTNTELENANYYRIMGLLNIMTSMATVLAIVRANITREYKWRFFSLVLVAISILQALISGSKGALFLQFIYIGIAFNYSRKRFSKKIVVFFMALFAILQYVYVPFNVLYRELTVGALNPSISSSLGLYNQVFDDIQSGSFDSFNNLSLSYIAGRYSNTALIARIIQAQDRGMEYKFGGTYALIFTLPIPRLIWPDKPEIALGNQLYKDMYGGSGVTSVGMSMVGEILYNFGPYLSPFVSLLAGFFLSYIYFKFRPNALCNIVITTIFYSTIWLALVFGTLAGNFAATFNGLVQDLLVIFVILNILGVKPALSRSIK